MARDLTPFLEDAYQRYTRREFLGSDPLSVPHRYADPADQEVAAFVAAGLAFGNVTSILRSVDRALGPLGDHPAQALAGISAARAADVTEGFNHRWVFARDLRNLYVAMGALLARDGGLEPAFAAGQTAEADDVRPGAASLIAALRSALPAAELARRGTRYLLPDALGPSACKRLHMFLRWMVREGDVDLGLWRSARPDQLLMPVDTHVGRIARYIGLTTRRTGGRATVLELTRGLRAVDPVDPVRFDFALSRLGILKHCPHRRDPAHCQPCPLVAVCTL